MKLGQIASSLGARLENGSPETEITGVAGIEEARAGQLTFVANPKYAAAARKTGAAAVIVGEDFPAVATATLRSKNPYLANARIGAYVVIADGVEIGKNAVLLPHVVIYRGVTIGDHFFAHAQAVVRED